MIENNYINYNDSTESVKDKLRRIGSITAKNGFKNEVDICKKFNNWKNDYDAQEWLSKMNYNIKYLQNVEAVQIPLKINLSKLKEFNLTENEYENFIHFKKADAQIKLIIQIGKIIKFEYISIKKANRKADFNQIDKRTVDSYQIMWGFSNELKKWLKLFTGETIPNKIEFKNIRDKRRLFLNEMPIDIQNKIIDFFIDNKIIIISDILKGRGGLSAGWMLVSMFDEKLKNFSYTIKDINTTMNFYGKGEVKITNRGSLSIGNITMQRKGGTPDPTKLQFKFNPCKLFEIK
jgi:hypothetical protein